MSTLKVNKLRDTAGSADAIVLDPNGGAVLAGVTTISTARITTGITTSIQVGGGVTISESGIEASGIGITCANINGGQLSGRRNLVINGGMKVAQRGAVGDLLYNYSGPDRFRLTGDGNQRSTVSSDSITVDSKGQSNAYKLDVTTASGSLSAGHYQMISYRFEGQDLQQLEKGTSNAKPVTLQFWVKSPKTGVHIVELIDQSNSSRHINKSYTVSSANTWQKVVITFEGDTTGAITNDNARRFDLNFWLMAGSTWTSGSLQTSWGSVTNANKAVGQVNVVDSTSNDFYLTGVQLEVGSQATAFEHRSFGEELALCQRYYYRAHVGGDGLERPIGLGIYETDSLVTTTLRFHDMRANPTLVADSGSDKFIIRRQSGSDGFNTFTLRYSRVNTAEIVGSGTMSGTAGVAGLLRSAGSGVAFIDFNAEL